MKPKTDKAESFAEFVLSNGRAPLKEESPTLHRWVRYQRERGVHPEIRDILEKKAEGLSSFLEGSSLDQNSREVTKFVCTQVDQNGNLPSNHLFYNWLYRKRTGFYKVYESDIEEASNAGYPNLFKKDSK